MAVGIDEVITGGCLVHLFPDWAEERFLLHASYPSRALCPPRLRTFVDFIANIGSR